MKTTCTLVLLVLSFALQAQKKNALSEIRKNTYQIEFGFNRITDTYKNTSGASVVFKKKLQMGKLIEVNSIKFLRAFLTLNTRINVKSDTVISAGDNRGFVVFPTDYVDLSAGLGFEKQFQHKSLVHYYGIDIFGSYNDRSITYTTNYYSNGVLVSQKLSANRHQRSIGAGTVAFIGLKYYFTNQFCVGLESGVGLSFIRTRHKLTTPTKTYEPGFENKVNLYLMKIRNINIAYTF